MNTTRDDDTELPPDARKLVPVKAAMRVGNWGMTRIYELIGEGKIKAYKDGRKTLIDLNTVVAYQASLPGLAVKRARRG